MKTLLLLSMLALAPQEPGSPATDLLIGGAEAPAQPTGKSRATYTRTERFQPQPGRGTTATLRAPIGTLVQVRGQESNQLVGVGLITGLAGTGDSTNMTRQLLRNLLLTHNVNIDPQQLTPKNIALVRVEATLPPGIQPGRHIDVVVSTLGDAKSLQGGSLAPTELTDLSGLVVYAMAAGPVNIGGFLAEAGGSTTQKNHPTVGTIALGGKVERAVRSNIVSDHGYIYLDSRASHAGFGNVARITESINAFYPGAAFAEPDGRTVKVRIPHDLPESGWVTYLDSILRREVEPTSVPRVVINERTGLIVMGEGVRLRPGAVAQGNLTVTIAESPEASQPGPLSGGETETLDRTELEVTEDNNGLVLIRGAVTLDEVVEVLNVLGTTPRELISILEAMAQAGLVLAEIHRM